MNGSVFWYALRQRQRALGMILTLAIGVTALVAVSAFAERLSGALRQGAAEALGGQWVLSADHAIQAHFRAEATRLGLRSALSTTFPSMVIAAGRTRLVEVKAVSPEYPLLGELWVNGAPARAPAAGQAWLEPDALTALGLAQGASFSLGALTLEVGGRLDREPDRAPSAFAIGPRVMIAAADLAASELLGFGSRATFRLHLAGEPAALQAFADYVRKHPERGQRLEGLDETRPQLRQAIERAQSLLRSSALLALLLAGLAVGIALQARLRAQLDAAATLRALGASTRFITHATLLTLLPTAVLGSLIGIALGYALQPLLPLVLHGIIPTNLPPPSPYPALLGLLAGTLTTLAFALPAVVRLRATPVLRILRRHLEPPAWDAATWGALLLASLMLAALLLSLADPTRLSAAILGGTLALTLILLLLASLPIVLARRRWLPARATLLTRWAQPGQRAHLTLTTLGLGLMTLTLAFSLRTDLLAGWTSRLPADAPNRFVINLLDEQRQTFATHLQAAGLPIPPLKPMIRARLISIDGEPIETRRLGDEQARALAEREFNLSMTAEHPSDNRIIAGRHWRADEQGQHWLSVEEGLARRLGIRLGSQLQFDIAGEHWHGTVLNLRKVRWDSFNVNFFVSTPPAALEGYPTTWITSFYLPETKAGLADTLVIAMPNITVIDIRAALTQVREVLARIEAAVSLVLGFVLLSAWLVLWHTAAASAHNRRRETALLRTLGASRTWLRRQLVSEYALLGLIAGLLAALAASLISAILARLLLEEWLLPSPLPWLLTPLLGALLSATVGWLSLSRTLDTPPAQVLRDLD